MKLKKFNELNDWMDPYNKKRMGRIGENHPDFDNMFYGEGYINPALKEHEDEIAIMKEKLEVINEDIEGSGPVDNSLADAIDALDQALKNIEKLKA